MGCSLLQPPANVCFLFNISSSTFSIKEVLSHLLIINCVGTVFKDRTMGELEKYLLIVEGSLYSDTITGLRLQVNENSIALHTIHRWEQDRKIIFLSALG